LGHIISEHGLATNPAKIQVISSWLVPTNVGALHGFLGLASYYCKFIKHFSLIAKPLNDLLCKDSLFIWTSIHASAFATLKAALCSAPVLGILDFSQPFHLETDALGMGVDAVLLQNGHPLVFISKALGPRNQGLSVYEKEYLAILMAVDQWRHYLLHAEFVIHTNHHNLIHLNEKCLHTPWQQKVFSKLLGLCYKVVYRRGSENQAADALSHRDHPEQLNAISSLVHLWLDRLCLWYPTDVEAKALLSQLLLDGSARPPFQLKDGIILYKDRIWLGSNHAP
jgi:hypothetical protein